MFPSVSFQLPAPSYWTSKGWQFYQNNEKKIWIAPFLNKFFQIGDEDPRNDGVEVRGASPFKVWYFGWPTGCPKKKGD